VLFFVVIQLFFVVFTLGQSHVSIEKINFNFVWINQLFLLVRFGWVFCGFIRIIFYGTLTFLVMLGMIGVVG